ncbi:hypothetical protein E3T61_11795 [Cryobacterium lactosi]|uniref:Uncharacterized protein n=1 Tax=Cryobacterium lactosi TaxID=1259202 RepID=A0A4R9BRM0_9MICO|nr:hypothetical protein [Cryobacterium lactosi]TFD88512.1 hypothetical protein E3T61_11795 [Cryobacterium lactosi]
MSETFSLILGIILVVAAIAISVFLYFISRRSRSAPLSDRERAEQAARSGPGAEDPQHRPGRRPVTLSTFATKGNA